MAEIFSQRPHSNETLVKLLVNETTSFPEDSDTNPGSADSSVKMAENEENFSSKEPIDSEPYDLSMNNNSCENSTQNELQIDEKETLDRTYNKGVKLEDPKNHNDSNTTPNYGNGMLANLNQLRHRRLLCDVIIRVGIHDFYAHKAVLASCSQYFGEKLLSEFQTKENIDILEIDSVSATGIELLLDFVYTGETLINDETIKDLKHVAEVTKVQKLSDFCERYKKNRSADVNNNYIPTSEDNDFTSASSQRKFSNEEPKDLTIKTNLKYENPGLEIAKQRRISEPVLPTTYADINNKYRRSSLSHHKFKSNDLHEELNVDERMQNDFKPFINKQSNISPTYINTGPHLKKYQFFAKNNDLTQSQDSDVFTTTQQTNKDDASPTSAQRKRESLSFSAEKLLSDNHEKPTPNYHNHFLADWEKQFSYGLHSRFNFTQQLQDWIRPVASSPLIKPMFNTSPNGGVNWHENPWANMFRHRLAQANFPHFNRELFPCYQGMFTPGSKRIQPFNLPHISQPYSPLTQQREDRHMPGIREQPEETFSRFVEAKKSRFDRLNPRPPIPDRNNIRRDSVSQDNDNTSNNEKLQPQKNEETTKKQTNKKSDSGKPYKCPLCEANFNRPANLKTHMRIHSGEKPYKCDTCGARFVQVAHLRAHVLIHTGEKPYPCNICGTSFRHLQTLKSHLRIHTGEKPYSCERCCVKFRHKSQLRLHLRTKHGIQTNTKKTYKQVPGLCSADICAHIKRAQEVAKCQNKPTNILGSKRGQELREDPRAFLNLLEVSSLNYSNDPSIKSYGEKSEENASSPNSVHEESNFDLNRRNTLAHSSKSHGFITKIQTA